LTTNTSPLADVIDDLSETAGRGTVSAGRLLDSLQDRSLGFILTLLGLMVTLPPIGAIPGVPDVASVLVIVAVGHSFVGGQRRFWAPESLRRREISAEKVQKGLSWIRPTGAWIDSMIHRRLGLLVESYPARVAIALIAAALALAMFLLSLIPWFATPASVGIMLFGLALMGRDGVLALVGYLMTGAAGWLCVRVVQMLG